MTHGLEGGGRSALTPRLEAFLAERRPTPYVVLDLDVVAARYERLAEALPGVALYYAVKANPEPELLRMLVELGCRFDVASHPEVELCLAAGAASADLSYGNPIKRRSDLAEAYARGVRHFAFDSDEELDKLIAVAPGSIASCRILCSGEGAAWPLSRKFGCPADQALPLLRRAAAAGLAVGVGFHVGSQQLDPDAWAAALRETGWIFGELRDGGVEPEVLNIGGGFPGSYADAAPPDVVTYGKAIGELLDGGLLGELPPLVVAEPGRYLVADAGVLQAEVLLVARKHPADAERWVYLDVGVFTGLVEALDESIRYVVRTPRDGGPTVPSILAGPTCDSIDILYEQHPYALPAALTEGDRVELLSTGAYTTTYSSVAFNGFPPLASHVLTRSR